MYDSHWVVVSNLNGKGESCLNTISYYDSSRPLTITSNVIRIVCSFFKCESVTVTFDIVNVMHQSNSYDCGIFAIANATELAFKRDPALCNWDCGRMRKHLLTCFERGKMEQFPTIGKRRIPFGSQVRKSVNKAVYCMHLQDA